MAPIAARLSPATRRLRSAQAQHQERLFRGADAASLAADRAVGSLWRELLATLRTTHGFARDYARVLAVLRKVGAVTAGVIRERLARLYLRAHAGAAAAALDTLPRRALERAAGLNPRPVREGADRPRPTPGFVGIDLAGNVTDRAALLQPPTPLSAEDRRELFADLLFPPPAEDDVLSWLDRFVRPEHYALVGTDADKRLPQALAAQIAADMGSGKSQREVAKGVLPLMDGSRVRARRAARTFGLYTANQAQESAWAGLGDLHIGYELIHSRVPDSRPWHTAREGRRYYFDPGPGQDGMGKCPHPPREPDDPGERPPGTPALAFNCLCSIVPILRDV